MATEISDNKGGLKLKSLAASAAVGATDSGGSAVSSTAAGLYAVGDANVKITDLAVAVTYKDYDNDGATTNRTEAQSALEFTGVQQAKDPTTGSNTVYKVDKLTGASSAAITLTPITSSTVDPRERSLTVFVKPCRKGP